MLENEARKAGACCEELRAHPENQLEEREKNRGVGICERIRGMLEARLDELDEGINERSWIAGTRNKPLLTLLIHCGLTPELSRAAKRLRLE